MNSLRVHLFLFFILLHNAFCAQCAVLTQNKMCSQFALRLVQSTLADEVSQLLYDYKFVSVSTFSGCDFLSLSVFVRSHTHWPRIFLWPSSTLLFAHTFFSGFRSNQSECCIFSDIIVRLHSQWSLSLTRQNTRRRSDEMCIR